MKSQSTGQPSDLQMLADSRWGTLSLVFGLSKAWTGPLCFFLTYPRAPHASAVDGLGLGCARSLFFPVFFCVFGPH